jgi:hypothetical protein
MAVTKKNLARGPALSAAIKAGKARAKREREALAVTTAGQVRRFVASERDLMTRLAAVLAAVEGLDTASTRRLLGAVLGLLP